MWNTDMPLIIHTLDYQSHVMYVSVRTRVGQFETITTGCILLRFLHSSYQ